jgi:hypothetical protein
VTEVDSELKRKYGLNEETIKLAEFQKYKRDGFVEDKVRICLQSVGFDCIDAQYVWYLG